MNTKSSTIPSKVAVVTGAASSTGKETVRRFLADGYVVHAAARRLDEMADLERDGAILHYLDTTDCASIRACAAAVFAYGELTGGARVDVVTNEAGQVLYRAGDATRQNPENSLFGLTGMKDRLKSLLVRLPSPEPTPAVVKAACL
ncbi:SDR family NAD(P)-dependent oxidoreductase [Pseudorhodoplanes sinuspersici]|uniref:Uncharacterized protein n=1 Tax=Pseudorhodoplanes sinuspersici TaxID=1235591 RepID=A0A1W6ZXB5_9HYPH|nr:SDR family NAD(P)-dependent oxidoreductase [Pseudorhodoplanes sinuspersici]ARQ01395.1 hypothetical protein CAK95_21520 [Pseudorhodoplanes sinuspersici]RKE73078.1 short subunit dehydrogenase [Pseudorhodoplanes sinuspersici]